MDQNRQCINLDPHLILRMQYVTGVETWTQLVYKPGPTFDITNATHVGAWTQLVYKPGPTFDIGNAIGT